MNKKIIIGSRGSKLALLYAQKAKELIIKNTSATIIMIFLLNQLQQKVIKNKIQDYLKLEAKVCFQEILKKNYKIKILI